LTRRQELNRQAQRTHRERKEQHIKQLEQGLLKIKEEYVTTVRERDAFAAENRRLREILLAHGIPFDLSSPGNNLASTYGGSSSRGSVSGGYTNSTGYTSPPTGPRGSISGPSCGHSLTPPHQGQQQVNGPNGGMDYDQLGIDFVLTYDRTPYLSPPPQQ
jgi:hypothetical protein